jgi:exopolysaccharide biosynthesis polyprenyl glycosylphosphotransferase
VKYSEILFGVLRIPVDMLACLAGLLVAYRLREASIDLIPAVQLLPQASTLPEFDYYVTHFALPNVLVYVAIVGALKLYALRSTGGAWRETGKVAVASGLWLALVIAWFFLIEKQLFFSRALLLLATVLISLFVMSGRAAITMIQRSMLRRGVGVRTVLSFGSQHLPEAVRRTLARDPRFKYLGHVQDTQRLREEQDAGTVDLVLHTDPNPNSQETSELIDHCRSHHIGYSFLPPVFADVPHQLAIDKIGLVPLLSFQPTPLDGWGRALKRMFDVLISAALIVMLSPLLLAITLLVLLLSGRPIFYVSNRAGQYGKGTIPVLKFRTMVVNAEELLPQLKQMSHRDGPLFKVKNDPRVTKIGRLLRRCTLDELPQLFNVFIGQLSLVGPRPHLPHETERYTPYQRRAFAVRPGMTGLSQISGRSNLKFDQEVKLDIQYIEEWSLLLDLWILWRTIFVVFEGDGAD